MKRIFFLAFTTAIFFSCCNKNVVNTPASPSPPPPPPPPPINYLIANAGSDTTICMTYGGEGNIFKGVLDGRASRDDSGKIVSYSWSEIWGPNDTAPLYLDNFGNLDSVGFSRDSSQVTLLYYSPADPSNGDLSVGFHVFMLTVHDDHGRVDSARVTINIIQNFDAEYNGLSWDSTAGQLTTISVKAKPGLMESWPTGDFNNGYSGIYLTTFNGQCFDTTNQERLPYVPYDSIQLTDNLVFYSVISIPPSVINPGSLFQYTYAGTAYPEIYAKTNSGIDFTQKVSIGFKEGNPPDSGWKILPKKLIRRTGVN
jgi:hypothetical protein